MRIQRRHQLKKIVESCFFHLRTISKISVSILKRYFEDSHRCISFFSVSISVMPLTLVICRLHSITFNLFKMMLLGSSQVLEILASLHWLPVHFHIEFNILSLTFKALHDRAPNQINDLQTPYEPRRLLDQLRGTFWLFSEPD